MSCALISLATLGVSQMASVGGDSPALAVVPAVLEKVWPYVVMVLGFSVIIFVHELGHFLAAKWAKVRVDRFAIGFGRELVGFSWGETRYSFNLLPFGGYVKMLGQEDFDDKSQELAFNSDPDSFVNKPVWKRMIIVTAGVVMNILFAILMFMIVFMVGIESLSPRVGYVLPDTPADKAGILQGDRIVSMNGDPVRSWNDISAGVALAPPHEDILFVVERNGEILPPVAVRPEFEETESRLAVGFAPGTTREIALISPHIDTTREDRPRKGDVVVAVGDLEVTDDNANQMRSLMAYRREPVTVERKDPANPDLPAKRLQVTIPPELVILPTKYEGEETVHLLGLKPLLRVSEVAPDARAHLAGLNVGDTILSWGDVRYPTRGQITRSIRDSVERDIPVSVRRSDGKRHDLFVRPKSMRGAAGTIQAHPEPIGDADKHGSSRPRSAFAEVRSFGAAHAAGIREGDEIARVGDIEHPTASDVSRIIRSSVGRAITFTVRRADGSSHVAHVKPVSWAVIDARFDHIADDVLRVGGVVGHIDGSPTAAATARIPAGALITHVNGTPVLTWMELVDLFRSAAGSPVLLAYTDDAGGKHEASFPVPHCLRTKLGVGPEARILRVDGNAVVQVTSPTGTERVSVSHPLGLRQALSEAVGKKGVEIEFRDHPFAPLRTEHVDVTPDMLDPWLGRILFEPSIATMPQVITLKASGPLDAIQIGVQRTHYFVMQVYTVLNRMIFSRTVRADKMSGPLGIIDMGGQAAQAGAMNFLIFLAMISANLAVVNFLPLPIMDGGLMVFLLIEAIKGSPVNLKVQVATQLIGVFLIVGIFLFVTFNDVVRMFG